jgi:hypothetical protein
MHLLSDKTWGSVQLLGQDWLARNRVCFIVTDLCALMQGRGGALAGIAADALSLHSIAAEWTNWIARAAKVASRGPPDSQNVRRLDFLLLQG